MVEWEVRNSLQQSALSYQLGTRGEAITGSDKEERELSAVSKWQTGKVGSGEDSSCGLKAESRQLPWKW